MAFSPQEFPSIIAWVVEEDLRRWNRQTEEFLHQIVALHDPGRLERLRLDRHWSLFDAHEPPIVFSDIGDLVRGE